MMPNMLCFFQPLGAAVPLVLAIDLLSPISGLAAQSGGTAMQNCNDGRQDRAACLREAGAARQEQHRHGLTDPSVSQQQQSARTRCTGQPDAARADCESRMQGSANSRAEGSAAGGGIIRETVKPASASR